MFTCKISRQVDANFQNSSKPAKRCHDKYLAKEFDSEDQDGQPSKKRFRESCGRRKVKAAEV